jgi:hypothetical protein
MEGLPLPQLPPAVPSVRLIVDPGHTVDGPLMGAGSVFTVTTAVREQPVEVSVKVTGAVPPERPATEPLVLPIVAAVPDMLHVPVPEGLLNVVELPAHTLSVPPMGEGMLLTVTTSVVEQPKPIE